MITVMAKLITVNVLEPYPSLQNSMKTGYVKANDNI